eukprot:scaffold117849_cov115-Phaeocystis_antarctica.AAC.2
MDGLGHALSRLTQPVHRPWSPSGRRWGLRHGHGTAIRNMHIKRYNSLEEMIGPVAQPWASVLCRLGASHVLGPPDKIVRAS